MRGVALRFLHNVIDRLLGVDSRRVLNTEKEPEDSNGNIAATMRTVIDQLKMEPFDTEKGLVDYENLKGSSTYQRYKQLAAKLRSFDPSSLESRAEKLAFWIEMNHKGGATNVAS